MTPEYEPQSKGRVGSARDRMGVRAKDEQTAGYTRRTAAAARLLPTHSTYYQVW